MLLTPNSEYGVSVKDTVTTNSRNTFPTPTSNHLENTRYEDNGKSLNCSKGNNNNNNNNNINNINSGSKHAPSTGLTAQACPFTTAKLIMFLWFEPLQTIKYGLCPTVSPTNQFIEFCRSVIDTTHVSHALVLVALLYIYRLRLAYPTVQGKPGSEYRLFATSLILANKQLEDNTYTNKTWSTVLHMDLTEIYMMEKEFLISLGYKLYVSSQEMVRWIKAVRGMCAGIRQKRKVDTGSERCLKYIRI